MPDAELPAGTESTDRRIFMRLDFMKRQYRQGLQMGADEEIVALLEPGMELEGEINVASGMFRLNCQFKGTIRSAGTIIVASQADVEGEIEAPQISIAGKVKGKIRALKQLEITEKGILLGDVETPLLKMDPGAFFTGHCDMSTHNLEKSTLKESVYNRERK